MSKIAQTAGSRGARFGVLLLGLVLSGCGTAVTGAYRPPPADPVPKRLTAEYVPFSYTAYFETDRADLDPAERARLEQFLRLLPPPEGTVVRIRGHADERLGEVYNADLAARRARSVAAIFAGAGYADVRLSTVAFGEAVPPRAEGWEAARRVDVTVQVPMITLPECPDWSAPSDLAAGNSPMSQLGCANALNLAAMIADPADLVEGRPLAGADGTREAAAVERYRADKVKKLLDDKQFKAAGK